jgi:(2Fe-2S) ferredoxin
MTDNSELQKIAENLGLNKTKRHLLFCAGDKCCSKEAGDKTWLEIKEWSRSPEAKNVGINRTLCKCLRVCKQGPIALVYPEGTWYHSVTSEVFQKIKDQHLTHGRVVEEYVFARSELESSRSSTSDAK